MSRIAWTHALVAPDDRTGPTDFPLYEGRLRLERTAAFDVADEQLVVLPDARAYRALSRAGLLLVAAGLESRAALAPFLEVDPFSVGLYCALENGPNDYASAKGMLTTAPEDFASTYKALRSAKQYFKQLANVPAAQLAIFLGTMGPLQVYNHSTEAGMQVLDQAEWDLDTGVVQAALVLSAFSLEDPLIAARTRRQVPADSVLCEAAAALLLVRDGVYSDWHARRTPPNGRAFGVAQDIVNVCLEASTCSTNSRSTLTSPPPSAPSSSSMPAA